MGKSDMQDMFTKIAAKFWTIGDGYHPLICHMLDVAAVAEATWTQCVAANVRCLVSHSLGLNETEAMRWVAFLAGCHDLGKASPIFQAKGSPDKRSTPAWLKDTAMEFDPLGNVSDPGHGTITASHLPDILKTRFDLPDEVASRLAVITGGHHGVFPSASARKDATGIKIGEPKRNQRNPWAEARSELVETLAKLLNVEGKPACPSNATSMLVAGFISVVDWIGSIDDEAFFPYAPDGPGDLAGYLEDRRKRARKAVRRLGWDARPKPTIPASFDSLFPDLQPRPLQKAVDRIRMSGALPTLVVIEAPMGEGKTEAAFYLAECWNAGGLRGAYIAMPTQATSNQLYERFREFLARRYNAGEKVNLQLLHGHASLNAGIKLLDGDIPICSPNDIDAGGEQGDATVGAAEWFTYRKRGLLAPFGVGTVDQALLSVLQVRHGFVRLFGLAGKTVIIDEVHAYDTYMSTLLERLLEWLAALGSPVVLLSATLPRAKRRDLVNAYQRGLRAAEQDPPDHGYPSITWATNEAVQGCGIETSEATRRLLGVEWLPPSADELAKRLLEQLRDGGCAAVVCNTVNRAQELYDVLGNALSALPEDERPILDLLHARFLFKDREEREERCLKHFGKPDSWDATTAARPKRAILIATQVIEQSLDLDFDFMVSEIAPVDLLLQRAGRMHRHQRTDRRGPKSPVLQILAPKLDEHGLPVFEPNTTYVYDEHVLLRTWHALRDRPSIAIPEDVEALIESVYREDSDPPQGVNGALAKRWHETFEAMRVKQQREHQEALIRRIPSPATGARLEDHTRDPREEDAPDLHPALQALTRLTDLCLQVALLPQGNIHRLGLAGDKPPPLEICGEILRRSVTVTAPDIANKLLGLPVPSAWKRSGLLRRMRMIELDDSNGFQIDDISLRYDPDLGVVIVRGQAFG